VAQTTQLKIVWSGPLKSLEEHRVSLSAFGEALKLLLVAARRIASNIVSEAVSPAETGRLASEANQIDIEIGGILEGSSGISALMTFQRPGDQQQPLFNQLTENVGIVLLEAIDAERQGHLSNKSVRYYLQALPSVLTSQRYDLHENGRKIKSVSFGSMKLPDSILELPSVSEIKGRVIGVGFEPGKPEVRIKSEEIQISIPATSKQVEQALDFRTSTVRALWLKNGVKSKLLRLEEADLPWYRPDADVHVYGKWDVLFRRLAR